MAQFYGKNSGYLIKKEFKYFSFSILLLLAVVLFVWVAMKFLPQGTISIVALIGIVFVIFLADPFLNFFRRKSNQYYRGSGGEQLIKNELKKLADSFSVFQDVTIGEGKGNLDFVVLGPPGLFIIEVKSHKGEIGYNGYELTLNGRSFTDKSFLRQVHGQTWALKNFLKQQTGADIHIHSALVFSSPFASMHFGYEPIENVYIVGKDFLLGLFDHFPNSQQGQDLFKIKQALQKTLR